MTQTPPNGPTPGQPNQGFPPPSYQPPNAAGPGQPTPPPAAPSPSYQPPASPVPGQPVPGQPVPGQPVVGQPVPPQQVPGYPPAPGYPGAGYPPQPGYPQQPTFPQQPGYPPAPKGKASSSKVLIIVIAAVVALALLGGGLMLMARTPKADPPVGPTQPSQPSQPTQPTQPTEQPTESTAPTEAPTTPTGGPIDLGHGVVFRVASGFQIDKQSQNMIKVVDGKSALITVVDQVDPNTNAVQLCDSYNRSLLKDVSGAQFAKAEKTDVKASNLKAGKCMAVFVDASGGSSSQTYVQSFIAVRSSDGVVTAQTVVFTEATPDSSFEGINEMLSVVLTSQAKG